MKKHMEKISVDNGQAFDFGKSSKEYAKYRDIYPKELYEKIYELCVGRADYYRYGVEYKWQEQK